MNELLLIATIHLLAVASPGPDLALVLKNSLEGGRKSGIYSALGVALGIGVHVMYSVLGLAVVISKSILLFNIVKLVGAAYLIYIGVKALMSKKSADTSVNAVVSSVTPIIALKQGFITNVLNPKATLFFLSVFTQVINPATSNLMKMLYGTEMIIATFIWFALVATLMTQRPVMKGYNRIKHTIDRVFGVVLIALGLKVALGSK